MDGDLLSIGHLAQATGIRPDTIRAWERKYGRPRPIRLPSGHRRYSQRDLRWMHRVAEALARGHRAGLVVRAADAELARLLDDGPSETAPVELLEAVRRYRRSELLEDLHGLWNPADPQPLLDRVASLGRSVGRAWADGALDVRHEHFLTALVGDFLRARREELGSNEGAPVVVLATLPCETHGLGIQMAALVCAWRRFAVRMLGVETPVAEIVRSARELAAAAVAIGVSLARGGAETDRMLRELRGELPAVVTLLVGGAGARRGGRGIIHLKSLAALARWLDAFG